MLNIDTSTLFLSIFFSIIGLGYFSYGRKNNFYFMLSGIALMVYPYFVSEWWPSLLIGLGLSLLPFALNKFSPLP